MLPAKYRERQKLPDMWVFLPWSRNLTLRGITTPLETVCHLCEEPLDPTMQYRSRYGSYLGEFMYEVRFDRRHNLEHVCKGRKTIIEGYSTDSRWDPFLA